MLRNSLNRNNYDDLLNSGCSPPLVKNNKDTSLESPLSLEEVRSPKRINGLHPTSPLKRTLSVSPIERKKSPSYKVAVFNKLSAAFDAKSPMHSSKSQLKQSMMRNISAVNSRQKLDKEIESQKLSLNRRSMKVEKLMEVRNKSLNNGYVAQAMSMSAKNMQSSKKTSSLEKYGKLITELSDTIENSLHKNNARNINLSKAKRTSNNVATEVASRENLNKRTLLSAKSSVSKTVSSNASKVLTTNSNIRKLSRSTSAISNIQNKEKLQFERKSKHLSKMSPLNKHLLTNRNEKLEHSESDSKLKQKHDMHGQYERGTSILSKKSSNSNYLKSKSPNNSRFKTPLPTEVKTKTNVKVPFVPSTKTFNIGLSHTKSNMSNSFEDTKSVNGVSSGLSTFALSASNSVSGNVGNSQDVFDERMDDVEMLDVSDELPSLNVFAEAMEVDHLADNQESYAFIVDTNIFIHHLKFLDELKDVPLEGSGPPCIYIPWIVIQELDGLKNSSDKKSQIGDAIRYIYHMLNTKHPRICGQTVAEAKGLPRIYGDLNDDILLSYCTVLSKKLKSDKVCLLTDDKNLCNKAMINDIKAYTRDNLFSRIKPDVNVFRERNSSSLVPVQSSSNSEDKKKEVDGIICEARFYAKQILEPFLYESMTTAFSDTCHSLLSPPPTSLCDILECYKKYWISVFGPIFEKGMKKHFETLIRLFSFKRGFFCNVDDAFAALIAMESIFKCIQRRKPCIRPEVLLISGLTDRCKVLSKPVGEEDEENKTTSANKESNPEVAYEVFNHIWKQMNFLCGMVMDVARIPHNIEYDRPSVFPATSEFEELLSNLCPAIHKIKCAMSKIVEIDTPERQLKHEHDYKKLYDYLLQFVPSLEIQMQLPPTEKFTVCCLKSFCIDSKYRNQIKDGYRQLLKFQEMLMQCIHLPIWKH